MGSGAGAGGGAGQLPPPFAGGGDPTARLTSIKERQNQINIGENEWSFRRPSSWGRIDFSAFIVCR